MMCHNYFVVLRPNSQPAVVEAAAEDVWSDEVARDVARWVREGRVVRYITAERVVIGAPLEDHRDP